MSRGVEANPRRPARPAFTLLELLAVIAVIALLLGVAVPAFTGIQDDNNSVQSINKIDQASRSASTLAARSASGQDIVLAFFYDVDPFKTERDRSRFENLGRDPTSAELAALATPQKRVRVQAFKSAGFLLDTREAAIGGGAVGNLDSIDADETVTREIFVPATELAPAVLPSGWEVRGYAPAGWVSASGWYGGPGEFFELSGSDAEPSWVFPETSFFSRGSASNPTDGQVLEEEANGYRRQTFVLRFEGGTGRVVPSNAGEILLLDPVIERSRRQSAPFDELNPFEYTNWERFALEMTSRAAEAASLRESGGGTYSLEEIRRVIGNASSDTVLARPVQQLAIYDSNEFYGQLGYRTDRETGTFYPKSLMDDGNVGDSYRDAFAGPGSSLTITNERERIRAWFETGFAIDLDDIARLGDPPRVRVRVYGVDLGTGEIRRVDE